jgi:hypothetical protein
MKSNEFEILSTGGDERLDILENGLNKYFINPSLFQETVFRGSCTCNALNSDSYVEINQLTKDLESKKIQAKQFEYLKSEIKSTFTSKSKPVDFDVYEIAYIEPREIFTI